MNKAIHFRPIENRDYESLEKLIIHTWGYEKFCSPKTAARMAKLYLAGCLMEQTFTCVAEYDGEAVGVIMCQNKRKQRCSRLKYALMMFRPTVAMLCTKEGRKVNKMFSSFHSIDRDLLRYSGEEYDGQLSFFALCSNQRGTGIGKALWTRGLNYLQEQGVRQFYLYTDTTCNFGFYEHHGMKRICKKSVSLKPHFDCVMEFYLYGYSLVQENVF